MSEESEEMDQSFSEYFEQNSKDLFVCKYNECEHNESDQNSIITHIKQHLSDDKTDENESKPDMNNTNEESNTPKKSAKYVCDTIGCNKQFSYLKCFKSHLNEHLVQNNKQTNVSNETQSDNNWEKHIEVREIDGKEKVFCKWNDCDFESNLRIVVKQHIINNHMTQKRIRSRPKIHNEYEYWDQILFDKKGIRVSESKTRESLSSKNANNSPKTSSPVKQQNSKTKTNEKIENEILAKKHLNIDKNKGNVLLSCKGLASMTKVSKYFVRKVINGEKTYFCKWMRCSFKTKKSQKIAEHINLSHIGVDFKCNKPNCNKVFKNPHSYREHQKNHICGFGSFGYGSKGVIGVCRNENLFKYRERIVIKGKKYYRCKCCFAITKYFTGMKRHIHSQHVCPFRINLHLTRTEPTVKQELMDLDLDLDLLTNQINNSFSFCMKCNEYFENPEDLRKHEIMFCKFRKETINKSLKKELSFENNNSKDMNEKSDNKLKLSEQIRRNVNAINESITATTLTLDSHFGRIESQSQNSVDKYIYVKNFEGIDYYLCKYNDCKFVTKTIDKINEHILDKHFANQSTNLNKIESSMASMDSFDFSNIKIKVENEENEEMVEEDIKPSTSGLQNFQNNYNIEKDIVIKSIDGEPHYFCKYKDCKYYSNNFIEMKSHVKDSHVLYKCDVENCHKEFKTLNVLNIHKVNHICGFGIKGRKSSGVCDLENIKQYRDERIIDSKYVYPCKWKGCRYVSETRTNCLSHIHNRHICPNRVLSNFKKLEKTDSIHEYND